MLQSWPTRRSWRTGATRSPSAAPEPPRNAPRRSCGSPRMRRATASVPPSRSTEARRRSDLKIPRLTRGCPKTATLTEVSASLLSKCSRSVNIGRRFETRRTRNGYASWRTEEKAMAIDRERQVEALATDYMSGKMSRRVFIVRLLALGLSTGVAGAILAACSSAASPSPSVAAASATAAGGSASSAASPGRVATGLKGTIRFLIGPWTDQEVQHHQVIQAAFNKLNPDVTFTYKLFDWATSTVEIGNSLDSGAHDIFYIEDHDWIAFSDRMEDLTPRINDPAFA